MSGAANGAMIVVLPPGAASMTDDEMASLGMQLWPDTFAHTDDLVKARQMFFGKMIRAGMPLDTLTVASLAGMTSAQWAHYGYPTVMAGHKFAAALMGTSSRVDSMEDIHVPWLAFRAVVPDGLLSFENRVINRVMVSRRIMDGKTGKLLEGDVLSAGNGVDEPSVVWFMEIYDGTTGQYCIQAYHKDLHGLLTESGDVSRSFTFEFEEKGTRVIEKSRYDSANRVLVLCQRYVLGLLVMLQSHPQFRGMSEQATGPSRKHEHRDGPPRHRTFVLGHPIKADCRDLVRQYLGKEKHAPPSFQSWVIGHYKRQVIGVGRSGRKVIWVEPYWRGPEEAPILVRPRDAGPPEARAKSGGSSKSNIERT